MKLSAYCRSSWAWARVHLGMSKEEFMSLTPAEWLEIVEAHNAKDSADRKREDQLVARLCMVIDWIMIPRKPGDILSDEETYMPKSTRPEDQPSDEDLRNKFMGHFPPA